MAKSPAWRGSEEANNRLREFLLEHGGSLAFTRFFWKRCEFNDRDRRVHSKYVGALLLNHKGETPGEISRHIGVDLRYLHNWLEVVTKPKLARYLEAYLQRGRSRPGWV